MDDRTKLIKELETAMLKEEETLLKLIEVEAKLATAVYDGKMKIAILTHQVRSNQEYVKVYTRYRAAYVRRYILDKRLEHLPKAVYHMEDK